MVAPRFFRLFPSTRVHYLVIVAVVLLLFSLICALALLSLLSNCRIKVVMLAACSCYTLFYFVYACRYSMLAD
jgi:hypothetical protein